MPATQSSRDDALTRATEAASKAAALRADLDALKRKAKPARAALRARDAAAERLADLRRQDAARRAEALARSHRAGKPAPAIAEAERALTAAQDEADAAEALLTSLRERAAAIRARIAEAETEQRDAAAALAITARRAAEAEWDSAVEALRPILSRMDAADAVLARLRISPPGLDAASLRRALLQDGLCLSSWGTAGRERPAWLHEPDREAAAEGAARLLVVAGLPADLHVPLPTREPSTRATTRPVITVTQIGREPPETPPVPKAARRVVRFAPDRENSITTSRDGAR